LAAGAGCALVALAAGAAAAHATVMRGPAMVTKPAVAGPATEGGRLTGSAGTWKGNGRVRLAYQWYRCDTMGARCSPLRGVTRRSHVLGPGDVGHTLSLAVRAADEDGSTT